jgi:hypothetical protein
MRRAVYPHPSDPNSSFIPLVIIMFRKKNGGISVVAKNVPQSERFFDNHYRSIKNGIIPLF